MRALLGGMLGGIIGAALVVAAFWLVTSRAEGAPRPAPTSNLAAVATAESRNGGYRIPTSALPPSPTINPTALALYEERQRRIEATAVAVRDQACREIESLYQQKGRTFDRRQPAEVTEAELLALYGIGDPPGVVGRYLDIPDKVDRCFERYR